MIRSIARVFLVVSAWAATTVATAAELPVREGLTFYLDVAEQPEARQRSALPPLGVGAGVEWLGEGRAGGWELVQPLAEHRPRFMKDGTTGFLRFDGANDFLFGAHRVPVAADFTLFVLAAPRANAGGFSGVLALSGATGNDYTHGLNLDFGPQATDRLSVVNVEGAGTTGGARDLLEESLLGAAERPFGGWHVFTVRSRIGAGGMELFLDGLRAGGRDRLESLIAFDRLVLGGRFYSNDQPEAPKAQGFFDGDWAAAVGYSRALDDAERAAVELALLERIPALTAARLGQPGHALQVVDDPPPVQMLVPGFSVEELPLQLGNLNNLRYRHDGTLIALGYDGRLHTLADGNGDGVPDSATVWWDKAPLKGPVGLALLPAGDARGEGAFVASKAKLSLLLDRDRDGRAEEEIVAADGWPDSFHGVDTVGVALDPKDGSIYFSIGCANFADAYLKDAQGKSQYRLDSPKGTVQRVSADLKTRETMATGVRFLCGMAINRHGDLFGVDQEGATWLPNGNPFDELLHIVRGRHYGFPPRHPRHLPDVLDEPSTFDFGPQHQSTTGLIFNEGVNGGPAFGPPHWHDDALICGESRGKLWRTKLVKTPEGYVAQSHLIACLNLLAVDACITPRGDLLVACHSGPPDWGTGPAGQGRLFLIKYVDPTIPQPVAAWAAAPDEFHIAFDKPLRQEDWRGKQSMVRVEAGEFVSAGDRFESVRPGYQVVRDQLAAPRRWVEVLGLGLTANDRTLSLRVPPQTDPVTYAVTLPLPSAWQVASPIAQAPELDIQLTLHGVVATSSAAGPRIVLPHPSPSVARALTAGSADHDEFFQSLAGPVTVRGRLNRANIFQPATQPGSTLDWDVANDAFANRRMELREMVSEKTVSLDDDTSSHPLFTATAMKESRFAHPFDHHVRPLALHRVHLPWVQPERAGPGAPTATPPRTDVAGRWLHGRRLYFGKATCGTCHTIRHEGITVGPDLTNLIHRDRESVIHDLSQPSATINPDHSTTRLEMQDGRILTGIVMTSDAERLTLQLPGGVTQTVKHEEIASTAAIRDSLMPAEVWTTLEPGEKEDLLTFLLTEPLAPAPITRTHPGPPPARSATEARALMPVAVDHPPRRQPLRILLSAGQKDHGLDEHDYPLWLDRWSTLLGLADEVTVTTCTGFPTREQLSAADVTAFYSNNAGWDLGAARRLDEYQQRGGGSVYIHWGIEGHRHPKELADRIGLAFSFSAFRHGEVDLVFSPAPHPITRGLPPRLPLIDETYWKLHGDPAALRILAHSVEESQPQPQIWVKESGPARVVGCLPGHYTWTLDDPIYRLLVLRALAWAARDPDIDRLSELSLVGARLAPRVPVAK